MKTTYQYSEIILISDQQADARWLVEVLKISGLNNELIWLKDHERIRDFITGRGLYTGKGFTTHPKIFIVNPDIEGYLSIERMLESNNLSGYQILHINDAKDHFDQMKINSVDSGLFGHKRSVIDLFSKLILV